MTSRVVWAAGLVNRKAETVRCKNRETGTTDFHSAFGFAHAAIMIGNAEHPLRTIYAAIRHGFQAKCTFRAEPAWASRSVAPATRRRMIFIRRPGALVPASATIYEFEIRPIVFEVLAARSVAYSGVFGVRSA